MLNFVFFIVDGLIKIMYPSSVSRKYCYILVSVCLHDMW